MIAVWKEQERYYMFDPNERSKEGKAIEKPKKEENDEVNVHHEEGAACVTWFIDLKELAKLYTENTPRDQSKEYFIISNAEIENYVEPIEPWNTWDGIYAIT